MLCLAGILAALVGCSSTANKPTSSSALGDNAITVGSFNFDESEVLAEIYSQALENGGFRVVRAFDLGPRELVAPALTRGLIELVPEYAGTALLFASLGREIATTDAQETRASLVKALAERHVTALEPAPAQDSNTFVVTAETATRHSLDTLSDVAAVAPQLTFGGPPECPSRPQCLAGLERVYGLKFKKIVRLDTGGPVTRRALQDGYVDVALMFTTDPAITRDGLVELADDRRLQPSENVIPLVRTEAVQRFGQEMVNLIDNVSARLTTAAVTDLNAQIASGMSDAGVATSWLRAESLL